VERGHEAVTNTQTISEVTDAESWPEHLGLFALVKIAALVITNLGGIQLTGLR